MDNGEGLTMGKGGWEGGKREKDWGNNNRINNKK